MTSLPTKLPARRRTVLLTCGYAALVAATVLSVHSTHAADRVAYMAVAGESRAPIGWVEFCVTPRAWRDLNQVNTWVNNAIKPMTDVDHWGLVEKWSYPDDGYGDCEDYVLLKRRMLLQSGWPREALLITVVRDKKDEGHAVLTVKTDRGDYVLDNQAEDVVLWSDTGYRFVKRQSQSDPNVWVSLGDPRPATATATAY